MVKFVGLYHELIIPWAIAGIGEAWMNGLFSQESETTFWFGFHVLYNGNLKIIINT